MKQKELLEKHKAKEEKREKLNRKLEEKKKND